MASPAVVMRINNIAGLDWRTIARGSFDLQRNFLRSG
jgi:hypothetical protein